MYKITVIKDNNILFESECLTLNTAKMLVTGYYSTLPVDDVVIDNLRKKDRFIYNMQTKKFDR